MNVLTRGAMAAASILTFAPVAAAEVAIQVDVQQNYENYYGTIRVILSAAPATFVSFSPSQLDVCDIFRSGVRQGCGLDLLYPDVSSLNIWNLDLWDGVGFAADFGGTSYYYFDNGAFNHPGVYTSLLGNPVAQLTVTEFSDPSVPEPAIWALMLAGFGIVGSALRRSGPTYHRDAPASTGAGALQ